MLLNSNRMLDPGWGNREGCYKKVTFHLADYIKFLDRLHHQSFQFNMLEYFVTFTKFICVE